MKGVVCPLCSTVIVGAQHVCMAAAGSILRRSGVASSCGSSSVGALSVSFSEESNDVKFFDRMEGLKCAEFKVGERVVAVAALAGPSKQEVEEGETGRVMRVYPCGLVEVLTDGAVSCFAEPCDISSLGLLQPKQRILTTVPLLLSSPSLQLKMPSSSPATITSINSTSVSIQFETGPRCEISPANIIPLGPIVEPPHAAASPVKTKKSLKSRIAGVRSNILAKIRG